MSIQLGTKIKCLAIAEDMWKVMKEDAMLKSTLYILDAGDLLSSMKLTDNDDLKTHLAELKVHFQTMLQCGDNLIKIGSTMTETRFNIIIMSSLPESYRPTLQMITASELASKLSGMQLNTIKADDLIAFIIKEAQHCVINNNHMKSAKSALAAWTKATNKIKGENKITCENCGRSGHEKPDCYQKRGDKEGQAPWQQKPEKGKGTDTAVIGMDVDENDMFAFTCLSDYTDVVNTLDIPKSRLGTCMDSGVNRDYCPASLPTIKAFIETSLLQMEEL